MSLLSFAINGATIAGAGYDLYKLYKNFHPVSVSSKSNILDITRDVGTKRISNISLAPLAITSLASLYSSFESYSDFKKDNSKIIDISKVSDVVIPEIKVKYNLIDSLNYANELKQKELELIKIQNQHFELSNIYKEAEINQKNEHAVSLMLVLSDILTELKISNDVLREVGATASDDMNLYFSELATFFKFQNTGILKESFNFFGDSTGFEKLLDSEGNEIIPSQIKAKSDAENYLDKKNENMMDYTGIETIFDDDNNENLLSSILNNVLNYDTSKDVAGEVML